MTGWTIEVSGCHKSLVWREEPVVATLLDNLHDVRP